MGLGLGPGRVSTVDVKKGQIVETRTPILPALRASKRTPSASAKAAALDAAYSARPGRAPNAAADAMVTTWPELRASIAGSVA
jgi:hypothetical protein